MSPPEPYVPTRRRRTWLWVVGGLFAACALICVLFFVWSSTDPGRAFLDGLATQVSVEATNQAGGQGETP